MSIKRRDDIDRMRRCVSMAMGCLDPLSKSYDERLAWYRLFDAMEGREPRGCLLMCNAMPNVRTSALPQAERGGAE